MESYKNGRLGGCAEPDFRYDIQISLLKRRGYEPMIDYYSKFKTSIW